MNAIILSLLLAQGEIKIYRVDVPKEQPKTCKITQKEKDDCKKNYGGKVPVCEKLGSDWTYRCEKHKENK